MRTPDPAGLLAQSEIFELQEAGEAAALRGDPPGSCPYKVARSLEDQARRSMWNRGYAAGRTQRRSQR
ncbi:hypothetical protein SAMN04487819_1322 [Actinopolyspora alba]|uniref:Uncharacterized protein n=1 Tax=Actinopolyspora alba TaxID=673379 RepID=A0A1I2CQV1_9ACTN|nr:Rmf/CrpP fold protein [Actinopolyspora alba]SFE70110.1 hypothetical protein SAMN04487819_1322 [Actinopolyspora alba]